MGWNFGDVVEVVAQCLPDSPALRQGRHVLTWGEVDTRTDALACELVDRGIGRQEKVGVLLYNDPAFMETYLAAFKAGVVPVNVNYRYRGAELVHLLNDADAVALVFHATFAELVDEIRAELPRVGHWVAVDDGPGTPPWADDYHEIVGRGGGAPPPGRRSEDDVLLLYTGGTTGLPKGVMWRQGDLWANLMGNSEALGFAPFDDLASFRAALSHPGMTQLLCCPLMHGTAMLAALITVFTGGQVVLLEGRHFDAAEAWRAVDDAGVNWMVIVGEPFARPLLHELDARRDRYELSSLRMIGSSGVVLRDETKGALLRLNPTMAILDSFGSSEALGVGMATSTAEGVSETATFGLSEKAIVVTDDGRRVSPGSGEVGLVALSGFLPVGYHKDPEKSARTFRQIDGVRYSIPGDYATVEPDGTIRLLGRGSLCINTGGEKVFPEEVEQVIVGHPAVRDAACIGVPDETYGESVAAVVERRDGEHLTEDDVVEHVKSRLAGFKAPRRVVFAPRVPRNPAGKVDYAAVRSLVTGAR